MVASWLKKGMSAKPKQKLLKLKPWENCCWMTFYWYFFISIM